MLPSDKQGKPPEDARAANGERPADHAGSGLVVSPDVRFAVLDGTVVLLELTSAEYFAFDDVGSDFWLRLVDPRVELQTALGELRAERGDVVDRFVDDCLRRNLLTRGTPVSVSPPSPRLGRRSTTSSWFLTARASVPPCPYLGSAPPPRFRAGLSQAPGGTAVPAPDIA